MKTLTAKRLRELITYEPETGHFVRRSGATAHRRSNQRRYIFVQLDGHAHYAHRLAFLYMTGEWPSAEVDHIDGDPHNNCWSNLRNATRHQNARNMRMPKTNSLGFKRVHFYSRSKLNPYQAVIRIDGKWKSLGFFATPETAHAVYVLAAKFHFGEFARAA